MNNAMHESARLQTGGGRGFERSPAVAHVWILIVACLVGGTPESAVKAQEAAIRFERVPTSQLPQFKHFNGHSRVSLLPEDNGSGCAWGDYDNDGDDDLFLCNINGPYLMPKSERRQFPGSRLWRNDGRGRFTDVTEAAGLDDSRSDMAAVFADYDNDGDADLFVTSLDGVRLYRNKDGRFDEVTKSSGLGGVGNYCLGAAWGDYDRDGRLDLYICRYVDFPIDRARNRPLVAGRPAPMTTPGSFPALANHLFHQEKDGTFRDVTQASGTANEAGRSMQAVWCDFDNDGWVDLYVANDQSLDCLYRNQHDGTFENVSLTAGIFDPRGGMGVALTDFQQDGDQDLLVTHWVSEDPGFYRNDSSVNFLSFFDEAIQAGLRKRDGALVGWGTAFVDFDNDGDQDHFIIHGSTIEDELTLDVLKHPKMLPQKSQVSEFRGGKWYQLGGRAGAYFEETHVGRGAAVADFDGDGRMDIAVNNHGGSPALLRNVSPTEYGWIKIKLTGKHCTRDAANARIFVHCDGAPPQMNELFLGASYLSCHTKSFHFGVGKNKRISKIEVRWPCGRTQRVENVTIKQTLEIVEQTGGKPG